MRLSFSDAAARVLKPMFVITLTSIYICYGLLILGVSLVSPSFIHYLNEIIKIIICSYLMLMYHPFRKEAGPDNRIIFSAALFLLTTTGISSIILSYLKEIKSSFGLDAFFPHVNI
jgi:hypothetical protein